MNIHVVTIAHSLPDELEGLIRSIMLDSDKHDILFHLFLHSQNEIVRSRCETLNDLYPIKYYPYGKNRGMSKSYNEAMIAAFGSGADVVIFSNDDVEFSKGDVDKLVTKAQNHPENYMVSCAGHHAGHDEWEVSHGYSVFALNPIAWELIGCFDENIFPAYMEDCDHHRRATLLGLVEENCRDTQVTHLGSATINNNELLAIANVATQRYNGEYYVKKWGKINEHEIYDIPFNDQSFDLYIDPSARHAPYPGYNRTSKAE